MLRKGVVMKVSVLLLITGSLRAQDLILRRAPRLSRAEAPQRFSPVAQIEGKVIDGRTGEPLSGAIIRNSKGGIYADSRGYFSLPFTSPETLMISFPEYRTLYTCITRPQQGLTLRLFPLETELEAIQIVADLDRESEAGAFVERLRSLEIGETYTQELISKRSTDFYLLYALRRLPGVSLLMGRFLSIRGLPERFNALSLGMGYLSPLSYDATLQEFDLFITSLWGQVEVRKFWTPDLPGHFGGGLLTLRMPTGSTDGLQVGLTSEIDIQSVGKPFPYIPKPFQAPIPSDFPSPGAVQASEGGAIPPPITSSMGKLYGATPCPIPSVGHRQASFSAPPIRNPSRIMPG